MMITTAHTRVVSTIVLSVLALLSSYFWAHGADAFYVPGVHPVDFVEDQLVSPKVGRVSSVRKHLPYDYYDLPHCSPQDGVKNFNANIGEVLRCEDQCDTNIIMLKLNVLT